MRDITIACVCMYSEVGEVEKNIERAEVLIDKALSQGAEMVCFPELSVSGYILNSPASIYDWRYCQEVIERIVNLARSKNVLLMAGLIEVEESQGPFISQIVAGPRGLIGIYRKTHLSPMEQGNFQAGEEIKVFNYDGVTFGIQLCWEAHFPEISTIMALKGAEVVFMPHASPRTGPQQKLDSWLRHMRSRAFDNSLYIAACNQVGKTKPGYIFPGVAVIIDPRGQIIIQRAENKEGLLVATLKADTLKEIKNHSLRYFLPHRRPELYWLLAKEG